MTIKRLLTKTGIFLISVILISSCATKQKVHKKTPDADYYYNVGLSYLNSGDNSNAIENLLKAEEKAPKNPDIKIALGIAYSMVGEDEKAKDYFKKAIELNPKKAEAYTNLGVLLAKEGKYTEAVKYFKKALSFERYSAKEKAYYNLALVYKRLGYKDKYEEYLKRAIRYKSMFLPAYISLGNFYLKEGRFEEAKQVFLKALNLGFETPEIYFGLGRSYYGLENYELAKKYLKKAYRTSTGNPFIKRESKKLLQYLSLEKKYPYKVHRKVEKIKKEPKISTEKSVEKPIEQKPEEKTEFSKGEIRFYIQVGIFTKKENASQFADKLKLNGIDNEIVEKEIDNSKYFLVIIGYFKSYIEASNYIKNNLKPLGFNGIIKITRL